MPRLIILLLSAAALAILALQNLATTVPLVVLGKTLLDIPLGLLLVLSVGLGALLTLFLYGLVGLRRAATSKYQPIGRRVPYPDSSGSTVSPSGPPSGPASATSTQSFSQSSSGSTYGSSSAFVSEPKSAPQSEPKVDSAGQSDKPFITPPTEQYPEQYPGQYPEQYLDAPPYRTADAETRADRNATRADRDYPVNDDRSSAGAFLQQPMSGLKSVFGKKKDPEVAPPDQPIGDDWGELRTTKQRNTWAEGQEIDYSLEAGAKSLYKFGRNVGENAGRLAEDIASGWNQRTEANAYDELDQGWENFDDYGEPPAQNVAKRTYGDSLYGDEDRQDDDYAEDVGPEDVYDADYRVIEPPSQPLS